MNEKAPSSAGDALAPAPEQPTPTPSAPESKPEAKPGEPEQAALFDTGPDFKAQLAELKKQNEKLSRQLKVQEEAKLEEAGKFKELADKRAQELEATQTRLQATLKRQALQAEAIKAGLTSFDYLKMVDMEALEIEGDDVRGADAAIAALKQSHPVLFEKSASVPTPSVTPGSASGKAPDPTRAYDSGELRAMNDDQFKALIDAKYGNPFKNPI